MPIPFKINNNTITFELPGEVELEFEVFEKSLDVSIDNPWASCGDGFGNFCLANISKEQTKELIAFLQRWVDGELPIKNS